MKLIIKLRAKDGTVKELKTNDIHSMFWDDSTEHFTGEGPKWENFTRVNDDIANEMYAIEECLENKGRVEIISRDSEK